MWGLIQLTKSPTIKYIFEQPVGAIVEKFTPFQAPEISVYSYRPTPTTPRGANTLSSRHFETQTLTSSSLTALTTAFFKQTTTSSISSSNRRPIPQLPKHTENTLIGVSGNQTSIHSSHTYILLKTETTEMLNSKGERVV
jgi:hypothetical protein